MKRKYAPLLLAVTGLAVSLGVFLVTRKHVGEYSCNFPHEVLNEWALGFMLLFAGLLIASPLVYIFVAARTVSVGLKTALIALVILLALGGTVYVGAFAAFSQYWCF